MNWAHVHLTVNHFPVVTTILGVPLLLVGLLKKSAGLVRAALGVAVAAAVLVLPAYFTGDPAEERIEHLAGVSASDISRHEEAAELAAIVVGAAGAVALAALVVLRRRPVLPAPLLAVVLVLVVAGAVLIGRAASLGGQIRHSEIRPGAAGPAD